MKKLPRKFVTRLIFRHSQLTYAQNGEDLILGHLFYRLNIPNPSYLDIGANDPRYISNTYYFYLQGSKGVCVEPNPYLSRKFKQMRPRDTVLEVGIGVDEKPDADFYVFPPEASGLSTFSKEGAEYWARVGMKQIGPIKHEKVIKVPLLTINTVMERHFDRPPDFISLDGEGLDLQILQSLDYARHAPRVICVETLLYDEEQKESKNEKVVEFLRTQGYDIHADTHVNTILVRP